MNMIYFALLNWSAVHYYHF